MKGWNEVRTSKKSDASVPLSDQFINLPTIDSFLLIDQFCGTAIFSIIEL